MSEGKIPWVDLIKDFKKRHPRLSKEVIYWKPQGFMKIIIYLKDGMELSYDYLFHRAIILKDRWKN